MSSNTPNLGLLKKDPMVDGNETFNIKTMLNDNWDKIDEAVGNVQVDIPDASTTQKGIVQLSNAIDGTRENVAATERAANAIRNSVDTFKAEYNANSTTVNNALALRAPIANPTFTGVARVDSYPIVTSGNISNYVTPPTNYDGNLDDLTVYVNSSTGSDSNNGLSANTAKKTISSAISLLPKVSPRNRNLSILGSFNEVINFLDFVGGSISIYCPLIGTDIGKVRGIRFENCTLSEIRLYNITIGDYDSNNPLYIYPLMFKQCSGYLEAKRIFIETKVTGIISGVSIEYCSGFAELNDIKISATGSTLSGTAFEIKGVPSLLYRCTCNSNFFYGVSSTSTTLYVQDISGIAAKTQKWTSQAGQILIAT
ncbi:phage tail protein [Paenibacillus sp. EC2-1]|uniref:phage tail protein n=1 Tax=Paenibacillus sp. EC2-1 TaxID=3388665 RepID=UPI003BEEB7DE